MIKFCSHRIFILCLFAAGLVSAANAEQLRSVEDFLSDAFVVAELREGRGAVGKAKKESIWLDRELKAQIARELNYTLPQLRIRYWGLGRRTAWILEEIGKEQPITMGVVVNEGEITLLDILAYRESRGGEVKYDFFKNQFKGVSLVGVASKPKLDRHIDGITGATLSVRAVKKVATLALFLHELTPYSVSQEISQGSSRGSDKHGTEGYSY